ncbi:somatostatin 2 [Salminus brasiliensis]|uniref:somatostatin 2 n=1 Tax=Salminus brasiliensis TaxID=930266 RepID=UPI003B8398D0
MPSSSLHLSLSLMCLLVAVGVISCGRSHMVLNSLEGSRGGPAGEELSERFNFPDLQWMLSNSELAPMQVEEPPQSRLELERRDNPVTPKPVTCMNYFWKSRTAC